MHRFSRLNTRIAYPGVLGVTTEKGQQDVKPNVLDAPTESYEIMLLRWETGVFEVGAPAPGFVPDPIYPVDALELQEQLILAGMSPESATELAREITLETYSTNLLSWSGIPVALASYLAASLMDGTYDADKAIGLGLSPSIADFLAGVGALRSAIDGSVLRSAINGRPLTSARSN